MKQGEIGAAILTALVALPLVFVFAHAVADGEVRRKEAPVRGLLGDAAYDALEKGEGTAQNYLGNDRIAPNFELRDQRGAMWRLSDHRGKVVVMNFWTITCGPCVEEMPSLEALAVSLRERDDVELVTVSADRDWATARTVLSARTPLRVLFDSEREVITGKFGTRLFPETWIIDKDGVIRMRIDAARDWSSPLALDVIDSYR